VGTHQKIAILKELQTYFEAKRKKVKERRSHAFPLHYTLDVNIGSHRKSYFHKKRFRKVLLSF